MANVDLVMRLLAEDRASGTFSKVGGAAKSTESKFKSFGRVAAGALAGVGLAAFAKQSLLKFSEVEDATSALQATYGETAKAFTDFAEESADAFNLSKREALNAATQFANFGRAAGLSGKQLEQFTTPLIERAADAASYFGGTTADAIEAFGAAMRGEMEPIRRYGVLLDDATLRAKAFEMGIVDTVKQALTPQQKTLAAQALILEKTAQVQGDVARTSDSMANKIKDAQQQMDDFQVSVGQTVALAVSPLLDKLNGAMDAFNGLPQPVKTVTFGVVALGGALLILAPRIAATKAALQDMGVTAGKTKKGLIGLGKVGGVIAGLTLLTQAVKGAGETMYGTGEDADELQTKLTRFADGTLKDIDLGYKSAAGSTEDFNSALRTVANNTALDNLGDSFAGLFGQSTTLDYAREAVERVDQALSNMVKGGKVDEARTAFEKLRDSFVAGGGSASDFDAAMNDYKNAVEAAETPTKTLTKKVKDQKTAVQNLDTAWKLFEGTLSQQEAADAQTRSVADLTESLKTNGRSFKGNSTEALANRDALRQAMGAVKDQIDSYTTAESKAKAYKTGVSELKAALKKQGLTDKEIARLLKPLTDMQTEVDDLKKKIPATPLKLKIQPQITGDGRIIIAAPGGGRQLLDVDYRANGGPVRAGMPYVVGERRAELFIPDRNGYIHPRVPGHAGMAGVGMTTKAVVQVHLDGRLVQTSLVDLERQQGGRLLFGGR